MEQYCRNEEEAGVTPQDTLETEEAHNAGEKTTEITTEANPVTLEVTHQDRQETLMVSRTLARHQPAQAVDGNRLPLVKEDDQV